MIRGQTKKCLENLFEFVCSSGFINPISISLYLSVFVQLYAI